MSDPVLVGDLSETDCEILTPITLKNTNRRSRVKPKVAGDWSDDDIHKLISSVEAVPILWNAANPRYKNKIERQNAWMELSENTFDGKFTSDILLAKWSNLRIQYRGYLAKMKTKSGQAAATPPPWKFFSSMEFVGRTEAEQTAPTESNLVS